MFGTEPSRNWWRRPVTLAAVAGLVAGVVIGGAGHSLPAASTHVMTAPATLPVRPRPTVTVTATVAGPISTVTATSTVTRTVPAARPTSPPPPPVAPVSAAIPISTPAGTPLATSTEEPPVSLPIPDSGPTALCRDGTLSYAEHHEGTCAHHRGIAAWYR
jgi:hypothetical protein